MFKKIGTMMMAASLVASAATVGVSAKKSGWVKTKGTWSYYAKGKTAKGLKKIGGSQYYFNNKGKMQTGLVTIGNKVYYFKKAKNGKAPLLKGKIFYSVGNKKGNQAIGDAIVKSKYNFAKSKEKNLKTVYDWLLKKMHYEPTIRPDFKKNGWYNDDAYEIVHEDYYGQCWDYAALTTLAAKATGYNRNGYKTYAIAGNQNRGKIKLTIHNYTVIHDPAGNEYVLDGVFDDQNDKYNPSHPKFFMEKYVKVSGNYYRLEKETGVLTDDQGHFVLPTKNTDDNSFVYQETGRK